MSRWNSKTLGEIAEVQSGGTPLKSKKEYWLGDVAWYSSGELNEVLTTTPNNRITQKGLGESNAKLFPKGSLLIGMYDTAALKMSILDRDAAFNQAVAGVKPNKNIDLKFIRYAIDSKRSEIRSQRRGVRQKNLSLTKIKKIELPFPLLSEQKRIVAILDEVFAGIDDAIANTEKNLTNARELFESYLSEVFSRKGRGWIEKKLSTVVESDCSLSYGIVQPGKAYEDGLPVARPTDLKEKTTHLSNLKRIDPLLADSYQRTKLNGGELLLCVRGSTGVVSIAADELKGANVTRGIVPIRFDQELIYQSFGYYMLISKPIQDQIEEKTYGAALMQINIRDLRKVLVFFPKRQEEQQILIKKLGQIEEKAQRLETIYQQKLIALNELKQSILQKAFTDEITADTASQATHAKAEIAA